MRMRIPSVSLGIALGCTPGSRSTGNDEDVEFESIATPSDHLPLISDLVRTHQEVFDKFVLFTISTEDCEYPYLDTYGPDTLTFTANEYPYPNITGSFEFTVQMTEDGSRDEWTMDTTYTALSAGEDPSARVHSTIEGGGMWTVSVPGRRHTLDATVSTAELIEVPLNLKFEIAEYLSDGYRFSVVGSIDDSEIDTTVRARAICPTDG